MTNLCLFARRIKLRKQDEHRVKSFTYSIKMNVLNERVLLYCIIVNQTILEFHFYQKKNKHVTYKFHFPYGGSNYVVEPKKGQNEIKLIKKIVLTQI